MNRRQTKLLVERNGVIALRADKTHDAPEIDKLLKELGNDGTLIPFIAIYPGNGDAPITFDAVVTKSQILDALKRAGPSTSKDTVAVRTASDSRQARKPDHES